MQQPCWLLQSAAGCYWLLLLMLAAGCWLLLLAAAVQ
jgi:hypothetical protein